MTWRGRDKNADRVLFFSIGGKISLLSTFFPFFNVHDRVEGENYVTRICYCARARVSGERPKQAMI